MSQRRLVSLSHKTTHLAKRLAQTFSKQFLTQLLRTVAPTLVALSFAGISSVAHAQGTMDFSGAQTLMGTFKTFAMYAGAVICLGGLIFAGIRMMSGRFQDAIPGLFGALFGAGVLGWGAGWIGFDHGYAVTSHSSQGLTAERVIVNLDSHVHADLINKRFAYVAVSRGSHDAHIYTDNAASLVEKMSHDVVKSSALQTGQQFTTDQGVSLQL